MNDDRLRLRESTAVGVWIAGVFLAIVLSGLGARFDSSELRDAGGVVWLLLLWEAFLRDWVLGFVLSPFALYQRRRVRRRMGSEAERQSRRHGTIRTGAHATI